MKTFDPLFRFSDSESLGIGNHDCSDILVIHLLSEHTNTRVGFSQPVERVLLAR